MEGCAIPLRSSMVGGLMEEVMRRTVEETFGKEVDVKAAERRKLTAVLTNRVVSLIGFIESTRSLLFCRVGVEIVDIGLSKSFSPWSDNLAS